MAASAIFTVNGSVPTGPVLLTPGATCTVALASTSGASDIRWMFTGASETVVYPTITKTGFSTATFTVPANPGHGAGLTLKLVCTNTGDEASALICVGTTNMIASTETTERGALGWAEQLNTNFRATVTGRVEFATHAAYRAAAELADGTFFTIVSPPGEWRYSASSGAGFTDDNRTILKRTGVLDAANGRAFSTRAGATVPTFDALRGLRGSNQDHVHVQAHTTFGDGGGGIFDRAAIGSYVDDGGTIATAGSNAWVRRSSATGRANICWWGADRTGVAASDTAFSATYSWVVADAINRCVYIPPGRFLLNASHAISDNNVTIEGDGPQSLLYAALPAGTDLFVFDQPTCALRMRKFRISGGAACGRAAMALTTGTATWLEFDVDLVVGGGWTYVLRATCDADKVDRGAFQWGKLRLTNLQDGFPGDPHVYPQHLIHVAGGYFNVCDIEAHGYALTGDTIHIEQMVLYPGGNYSLKIKGSSQGCNRGLYLIGGGKCIIENWAEEANALSAVMTNVELAEVKNSEFATLTLTGCNRTKLERVAGQIVQDATCYGNYLPYSASSAQNASIRANVSELSFDGFVCTGLSGQNLAGFGISNPQNIALGGDFARFMPGATRENCWGFTGNYSATRCGTGESDTTKTRDSKHCGLFTDDPSLPTSPWFARCVLTPPLDQSLLGCLVVCSIKFRRPVGELDSPAFCIDSATGTSAYKGATALAPIECEDGWYLVTLSYRITQDLIDDGIAFYVYGANGTSFYFAELSANIGYGLPRHFVRCSESPFWSGVTLNDEGGMTFPTDGAPASANDPIKSRACQDGDLAIEASPEERTATTGETYMVVAHRRSSSSWVEQQLLTSLVEVT